MMILCGFIVKVKTTFTGQKRLIFLSGFVRGVGGGGGVLMMILCGIILKRHRGNEIA